MLRNIGGVLLGGKREQAAIERLILAEDALAQADAEVAAEVRSFLKRAYELLPSPEAAVIAPDGFDAWRNCLRVIQGFEVWQHYGEFITTQRPELGPGIRQRMAYAASVTRADADAARAALADMRSYIRRTIEPGSVVCLPTAPCIAPEITGPAETLDAFRAGVMALTCIAGIGGLPQVTLPVGYVTGCPVGASLIGWAGADETLLEAAVTLGAWCGP